MLRNKKIWLMTLGLFLGFCLLGNQAYADSLIRNSVPNLTTVNIFQVPAGEVFLLKTAVIAVNGTTSTCCQRIFRDGAAVTAFISVQGQDSIQITFDPPLVYRAGQRVQVRNGASSGPTSWTLTGTFLR